MYRIGILAKPSAKRFKVKRELQKQTEFHVDVYSDVEDMARVVSENQLQGLVLLVERFSDAHLQHMDELAHKYPELPIAFVTTFISDALRNEAIQLSFRFSTVVDYHFELNNLNNLMRQAIVERESMYIRGFCRFNVNQYAYFETSNGRIQVNLLDISKGGAKVKLNHAPPKKGTQLTVVIPSKDKNKSHYFKGVVAWNNLNDFTLGVSFIKDQSRVNSHLHLVSA
ncbi:MAG: PilZ domain-containing protein [Bdellovibrionaceae bacterium]|jgi:hypothetical protein|nr:PilZ domain-containing protein [Pseudobdellovibrionaceae bacterium]